MTPTSVYAKSSGWDPAFVWPLVRATSTPPAPNSKPVGFPPCATPRLVGPPIPPLSRRWRSGSKPWLPPTPHQPHLYHTTAYPHPHLPFPHPDPDPVTSHPHLLYHPPSPHLQPPLYHPYPYPAVALACALSPLPPQPSSLPPLYTTLPRRTLTSTGQGNLSPSPPLPAGRMARSGRLRTNRSSSSS